MKKEGFIEAAEWLRGLDGEVRRIIRDRTTSSHPKRDLTSEEWARVQELIKEFELPCYFFPLAYGFSLVIFSHGEVQGENPPFLLEIQDSQFPIPSAKKGFAGQEETLELLSSITHTPRNAELLKWYGFRPLDAAERYAY